MKRFRLILAVLMMITVFVSGFANGYIQRHQIEVRNAVAVNDGVIKMFPDDFVTKGFINTKKTIVISKNHLVYLAKKELTKEETDNTYPHIYYYKVDDVFEILFDTHKREPNTLYCGTNDPSVYIDKNGVTVLKLK